MVEKINPDDIKITRHKNVELLPAIHQTATLQKFFAATVDHLFQPGNSKSINGYIGQKPWYYKQDEDFYIKEASSTRSFYQLEPSAISVDNSTGNITNLLTYPDFIDYLRFNGANVENHDRLFSQEYYSWCPPINIDMLLNYKDYYWIKDGPNVREILPHNTYKADGIRKKYKLPIKLTDVNIHQDVSVWIDGKEQILNKDFILSDTEVNFYRIPKSESTISMRVYIPISLDDIKNKKTWTTPDSIVDNKIVKGFALSCGMKIRLYNRNDNPVTYTYSDYIVEGVGRSIELISDNTTSIQEIIPYIKHVNINNETVFALPDGDIETYGVLVKVDNIEQYQDLQYALNIKDRSITFFKSYIPDTKAKIEIWLLRKINIDDILGKQEYTSPNFTQDVTGIKFINNLLVHIVGNTDTIISAQYDKDYIQHTFIDKNFIVRGVGTFIELEPDKKYTNNLDFKDYFVMERGDTVGNDWSYSNRWFHRSVIDFDELDNTITPLQAKRPIIEFEKNLELYNYGRYRRKECATILAPTTIANSTYVVNGSSTNTYDDGVITNIFQTIHGKDKAVINGCELKAGMRMLVTTDVDPLINNRVFLVSRDTKGKIRLTLETDGQGESAAPIFGEIIKITHGNQATLEYVWKNESWMKTQHKNTVNQFPLFALYDVNNNALDDPGVYPNSDFNGNPIFNYQISSNKRLKNDSELNKPLSYGGLGLSEFIFENYLYTLDSNGSVSEIKNNKSHTIIDGKRDSYTYYDSETTQRVSINGFYFYKTLNNNGGDEYSNGWHKTDTYSRQYILDTYVATGKETIIELSVTPITKNDVIVFKNGTQLTQNDFTLRDNNVFIAVSEKNDFFEIKTWNGRGNNGHYTIPLNLQANPDNKEITTLTRGTYFSQFADILNNQYTNEETVMYRDSGRLKNKGTHILQHSAPLLKAMVLASNKDTDVIYAIRYAEQEYKRIYAKILAKTEEFLSKGRMDTNTQSASEWLNEILKLINVGKTSEFAFNNSGMAGENTFIPPTPSFLGLYPVYEPIMYYDDSYITPTQVIRGHDGNITKCFGDFRDNVIFELEQRIYKSIPYHFKNNNSLLSMQSNIESKFRKTKQVEWTKSIHYTKGDFVSYNTNNYVCVKSIEHFSTFEEQLTNEHWVLVGVAEYSRKDFVQIYNPIFERWSSINKADPRINKHFDPQNPWTWNWSKATDHDGEPLPGYWRGIYHHYYDTDTPHLTPWEMLGFSTKPSWWENKYGPAPYTSGNTVLWNDLEEGYIADGPRKGHDNKYRRYGLSNYIPVNAQGRLLNPIEAGIVPVTKIPSYTDASLSWQVGDMAPVEHAWRRSFYYPFDFAQISFLMKPAQFIELGWEPSKITRLSYIDQIINSDTLNRPSNRDIYVHNERVGDEYIRKYGVQQWISDWIKSRNQNITTTLGNVIRGLDVNLIHKMGGFTTINDLVAVSDSYDIIPQEDMKVLLYRSPSIREEFYGGVIIQWTGNGWKIFGYDVLNPVFPILAGDINGPSKSFVIGGSGTTIPQWKPNTSYNNNYKIVYENQVYKANSTHTSSKKFDYTMWDITTSAQTLDGIRITEYLKADDIVTNIPYGYKFDTQQEVYNFLIGYQRYLETRGWVFDAISENNTTEDFKKYAVDFLNWSLMNTANGDFIAISPSSMQVKFKSNHGMVQNIEQIINGVYSILDRGGYPINAETTSVSRFGDEVVINTQNGQGIYALRLYVSEIEHILVFNNKTIFNNVVYDPVLNSRLPRIRIQGQISNDWKGRLDAPGFIITGNVIVPNFEKSAENFRNVFNLEVIDDTVMQKYARHNYGYQRRPYLDNLLLSETTQFDFYRGMIRQKGTVHSMKKILRSSRVTNGADVNFFEEWAFRIGDFGAKDTTPSLEILLRQKQITNNPQIVQFTNIKGTESLDVPYDDKITIYADDERWMHKPIDINTNEPLQLFDTRLPTKTYNDFKTAGPVKITDVNHYYVSVNELVKDIENKTFNIGELTWIYDNKGRFDVLMYDEKETTISGFYKNEDEIRVISDEINSQILVIPEGHDYLKAGIYSIGKPEIQSHTWERTFGYDTFDTEVRNFTLDIDVTKDIRDGNTSADYPTPYDNGTTLLGGVFKKTIISKDQTASAAVIKSLRISTIEFQGDNFRGLWTSTYFGKDKVTSDVIATEFGSEYINDTAFKMPTHNTRNGLVYVYINDRKLPENSYIVSQSGQYVLINRIYTGAGTIQYRDINPTDKVRIEVISNPKIALGTASNIQRFFKFSNTPDITNPMGVLVDYTLPYYLSIDDNSEPSFDEEVCVFIDHDGCTQGKLHVEMEVVYIAEQNQQKFIEFPAGGKSTITDIEIDVIEPFSTTNILGNNQVYIGDTTKKDRYVGKTNFPASNLTTKGIKKPTLNTELPMTYIGKESMYVNFNQAWSSSMLSLIDYTEEEKTSYHAQFDYLTSNDEYFRTTPKTFKATMDDLQVLINGIAVDKYDPFIPSTKLRYNIIENADYSTSVYFGERIQEYTNAKVPVRYDVTSGSSNPSRVYNFPALPTVELYQSGTGGITKITSATALPVMGGGQIDEIILENPGVNYMENYIKIDIIGDGNNAQAHAIVVEGKLQSIVIDNPGSNYFSIPTILITDTSPRDLSEKGYGASAYARLSQDGVVDYIIGNSANMTSVPEVKVVTKSSGEGATGRAVIRAKIGTIAIKDGGAGYTTTPSVTIKGVNGRNAAGKTVINRNGSIIGAIITNKGYGYVTPPIITFSNPQQDTGVRATAIAIIDNIGQLIAVKITNAGSGYTQAPDMIFDNSNTGGPDITGTATLSNGIVTNITVNNNREFLFELGTSANNYITGATITISGTSTKQATAVIGSLTPTTLTGIRPVNIGSNYVVADDNNSLLEIRIAEFDASGKQLSTWEYLSEKPSMNEGYYIHNGLIHFMKTPQFIPSHINRKVYMEIIQHVAHRVPRTEDVDIISNKSYIQPAKNGKLNIKVHYTLQTSLLTYLGDDSAEIPDIVIPDDKIVVNTMCFRSVVFKDSMEFNNYTPYTPWKKDDKVWIMDADGSGLWKTLKYNGTHWDTYRIQNTKVDVSKFKNAIVYNKKTNETNIKLQLFDPVKGYFPGLADSEIWYKLPYDPSYYTHSDNISTQLDINQAWDDNHVGRVWWDTSTTYFLDYEIGNETEDDYLQYRYKNWGKLAPNTSIDLYEWVESPVSPMDWQKYVDSFDIKSSSYYPSGEIKNKDNPSWVEKIKLNKESGLYETYYYFWVKNSTVKPKVNHRYLSLKQIEHIITNPMANNLIWFAPIDVNTLVLGGIQSVLDDTNSILQVNWSIGKSDANYHKQWMLLREGDERSRIPTSLWNKMRDSLVGWDEGTDIPNDYENHEGLLGDIYRQTTNTRITPKLVPDQDLSSVEMIGISVRPRQTMFMPYLDIINGDKFYRSSMNARKNFIEMLNHILYTDKVIFDIDNPPFPLTTPYPVGKVFKYYIEQTGEYEFVLPYGFNTNGISVYIENLDGIKQDLTEFIITDKEEIVDIDGGFSPDEIRKEIIDGGAAKSRYDDIILDAGTAIFNDLEQFNTSENFYRIEKFKQNGKDYSKIIFPRSNDPNKQQPGRYVTLTATSGDYYDYSVKDFVERDELIFNGKFMKNMKVLVTNSIENNGFWSLWKCNVNPKHLDPSNPIPENTWELLNVQTYDIRSFIEEMDWWDVGYDVGTPLVGTYDTTAHRNASLPNPSLGDVVKIYDDGYGKWMVTTWTGNTWSIVGKERLIKKLSKDFYNPSRVIFAGPNYFTNKQTWNTLDKNKIWNDIKNRDGSWELKILMDNLNGRLNTTQLDYILDAKQANQLFFGMVNFAHAEQNMIDWAFKTSFLYIGGYNEPLIQKPVLTADQTDALQSYIEEVKPYHVKIRDFVRRLSPPIDEGHFYATDFDKPAYYDSDLALTLPANDKSKAYRPLQIIPNKDGTYTVPAADKDVLENKYWPINLSETDLGKQYWHDWFYNFGKNPYQPENISADPTLIRKIKTSIKFDRVDDYNYFNNYDGDEGNNNEGSGGSDSSSYHFGGWGGTTSETAWDTIPWDMDVSYNSDGENGNNGNIQYPGMPKDDPVTLIPGIDYRGVVIDGYSFQYGQQDVEIKCDPYYAVNTTSGLLEMIPFSGTLTPYDYMIANKKSYEINNKVVIYYYDYNNTTNLIIHVGAKSSVNNSINISIHGLPVDSNIIASDYIFDANGVFSANWTWKANNPTIIIEDIKDIALLKFIVNNPTGVDSYKFMASDMSYVYIPLATTATIVQKFSKTWLEDSSDNYDLDIDGRQMDQAQIAYDNNRNETESYDIDVDGDNFINPYYDAGHPPELVKVKSSDPFALSVYQTYSPGSPIIYSQRMFGGYSRVNKGDATNPKFMWGPYLIGQDAQNIEGIVVHINGLYQRLNEDYSVDVAKREVWFFDKNNINPASSSDIIQITSFTVGGGTPYQTELYEGDRKTYKFKIPNDGVQNNKRIYAYMDKTNDIMFNNDISWDIRNTTYNEKLYSVAHGINDLMTNPLYVAVGEKTRELKVTEINKNNVASNNATITTTQEHNLVVGMTINMVVDNVLGGNPSDNVYTRTYVVKEVINAIKFSIEDAALINYPPPKGNIYIETQPRIIYSDNGIFWTTTVVNATDDLLKVYFDGREDLNYRKRFIAVGKSGNIVYSNDGITWQPALYNGNKELVKEITDDLLDVTYIADSKKWVAVGNGIILESTDNGTTWSKLIEEVKFTIGVDMPLTGPISAEDDIQSMITYPDLLVKLGVTDIVNHTGLSMGAMDLTYKDINGNPANPNDDNPFLWQVDKIYVRNRGWNGKAGQWTMYVDGGQGRHAKFSLNVGLDGQIAGTTTTIIDTDDQEIEVIEIPTDKIYDYGAYSIKPYELSFSLSGSALGDLGISQGQYLTVHGDIVAPVVTSGKKLKIGKTTITFGKTETLENIITIINRKSSDHNVVASEYNGTLKLTIPAIWNVVPAIDDSLPQGSQFILKFRPLGADLPLIDGLLQNMLVWNSGDTILLNGQKDKSQNGVYTFTRGGAGSQYTLTPKNKPTIVYDKNDGVGYFINGDSYTQQFINFNSMKYINNTLFIVGNSGSIITSDSTLTKWESNNLRFGHDLLSIDAIPETFIAVGKYGFMITSEDGFTWHETKPFTKVNLRDVTTDGTTWIVAGDKGSLFRSNDNGVTWQQDDSEITTDILSTQYINGVFVNTFVGVKKMYRLNGPYDTYPSDYIIENDELVFNNSLVVVNPKPMPLLPYGHFLKIVNMGTIIEGQQYFKTKEQSTHEYIVYGHPNNDSININDPAEYERLKKSIFITLNGEILDTTMFGYSLAYDNKYNKITKITLNGAFPANIDMVVTLFNDLDMCVVRTDTYAPVVMSDMVRHNTGKSWTSGWKFNVDSLKQNPGSTYPVEGNVIVKRNGIELMPPIMENYTADGDTLIFPLSPPVARNIKIDVYVNKVLQTIGNTINSHCSLVIDYGNNTIIGIKFKTMPLQGDNVSFVIYDNHDYVIATENNKSHLIIVDKQNVTTTTVMLDNINESKDRLDVLSLYKFDFSLPSFINPLLYNISVTVNNTSLDPSRYTYSYINGLISGIKLYIQPDGTNGLNVNDSLTITAVPVPEATIKEHDEFSVITFREDTAMRINTEIFKGASDSNIYILKNKPYNTDSLFVTLNGKKQIHMNDYKVTLLTLGGWDTYIWGGKEQYGPYRPWTFNPDYIEYLNLGGGRPIQPVIYGFDRKDSHEEIDGGYSLPKQTEILDGGYATTQTFDDIIDGGPSKKLDQAQVLYSASVILEGDPLEYIVTDAINPPAVTQVGYTPWAKNTKYLVGDMIYFDPMNKFYKAKINHTSGTTFDAINWNMMKEYSGPTIYYNPSMIIKHGPDAEPYSWDTEFEGAAVEFDISHMEQDRIKITTFNGNPYRPPFAWRVFRTSDDRWEGIRIADVHKTYLVNDLRVTDYTVSYEDYLNNNAIVPSITTEKSKEDYEYQYGQVITLTVNPYVNPNDIPHTILPSPNKKTNIPGVVWVGTERIEYNDIKNVYNTYRVLTLEDRDAMDVKQNEVVIVDYYNITPTYTINTFNDLENMLPVGKLTFEEGDTVKINDINSYYEWSPQSDRWVKLYPNDRTYYKKQGDDWVVISKDDAKHNYLRNNDGVRIIELRTLVRGSFETSYGVPQKSESFIYENNDLSKYKEIMVWMDGVQMYTRQTWLDNLYPANLDETIVYYIVENGELYIRSESEDGIKDYDMSDKVIKIMGILYDYKTTTTTHEKNTMVIDGSYQQALPSFSPNDTKNGGLAHSSQEAVRFLIAKKGTLD